MPEMQTPETPVPGSGLRPAPGTRGVTTFDWSRRRTGSLAWLALFIAVSVLVHAGFFYLFRVVQPVGQPPAAPVPDLIVLRPAHEDSQRLLGALSDQDAARWSTVELPRDRLAEVEALLAYLPSFAGFQLELAPWPGAGGTAVASLPPVLDPATLTLPRHPGVVPIAGRAPRRDVVYPSGSQGPAATPPAPTTVVVTPGGDLAGREVVFVPEIDRAHWQTTEVPAGGRAEYIVAIDGAGAVVHRAARVLPGREGVVGGEPIDALVGGVRLARSTGPAAPLVWGVLSIEW